ncbi:hypothetical protein [Micromonospora inyonensis]|uniref:hypothetical protein n=1 Tax=Micromonospora inyonensis TaxID=47866 RepID=UPI00114CA815|nr:hypothetical protein [Micromonospora inyonensis]
MAVRLPLEPGAVAHRATRNFAPVEGFPSRTQHFVVPACRPDEDPCAEFTAGWADHFGAVACTEPSCFPESMGDAP